ncbi:MHO_1590 family protein [Mycoplasma todarodis]|uniref:MHO_1590 family protein n=1 Tax=Mycoplasma todarodis TaxID=1937191 RepID=UPI003B2A7676
MNKINKIIILSSPVFISGMGVGIYYIVKNNKKDKVISKPNTRNEEEIYKPSSKTIFPSITFDEVYDEIVIDGKVAIISDEMIAKMIKLVFMRINTSQGEIKVEIGYRDKTNVELKFSWICNSKIQETKIYNMKLKFQDLV